MTEVQAQPPVDDEVVVVTKRRWRRLSFLRRRGARKPLLKRFDLNNALFILPNAFTCASIFCGMYAIMLATSGEGGGSDREVFYQAALAIFVAGFLDGFDGRVARLTKTQSDFGVQMDSLADVISFGVAPAVLVYRWALMDMGLMGKLVAVTFAACGAIRLARFNVLSARGEGGSDYFIGLPIPMAAAMLIALVIAQHKSFAMPVQATTSVSALVGVLSYLMVSNVRYYTFKRYRPSIKNVPVLLLGGALSLVVTVNFRLSITIVLVIGGYILMGLVSELLFYRKRKDAGWTTPRATSPRQAS